MHTYMGAPRWTHLTHVRQLFSWGNTFSLKYLLTIVKTKKHIFKCLIVRPLFENLWAPLQHTCIADMQCMYGCMYAVCMDRPTYVCIYIIHADGPCTCTHVYTPISGVDAGFLKGGGGPGADTGFPEGGGGGEDSHNKHPPTSSALRKIEKHPHSLKFTSTPPWTLSA